MRALIHKLLTGVWVTGAWIVTGFPGNPTSRRGRAMCWLIRVDAGKVDTALDRQEVDYPSESER